MIWDYNYLDKGIFLLNTFSCKEKPNKKLSFVLIFFFSVLSFAFAQKAETKPTKAEITMTAGGQSQLARRLQNK